MKPIDFNTPLDTLEKGFRKIKTIRGINTKYEFLTGENAHDAAALLLSVHYGSNEEVAHIKELIIKSHKRQFPNRAALKRIKMASGFYAVHRIMRGK